MMATAGTLLSAAVTILAVLLSVYTMVLVGRMRSKHGVHAPAVTGAPEFERAFRVQMNTLEQFVLFLPLLWLATVYPVVCVRGQFRSTLETSSFEKGLGSVGLSAFY